VAAVRDLVAGAVAAVVEVPPPGLASTASSRRCGDVAEANASTLIRRASPLCSNTSCWCSVCKLTFIIVILSMRYVIQNLKPPKEMMLMASLRFSFFSFTQRFLSYSITVLLLKISLLKHTWDDIFVMLRIISQSTRL